MAQEVVDPSERIEIPLGIDGTLTQVFAIAILSYANQAHDQVLAASVDHVYTVPVSPLTLFYEVPQETPKYVLSGESIILTEPHILSVQNGQITIQCEDGTKIACSQVELLDALCGVQRLPLQPIYHKKLERAVTYSECAITLANVQATKPPFVLFFSGSTKSTDEFHESAIVSPESQFHLFLAKILYELISECALNGRNDILSYALDCAFKGQTYREYLAIYISSCIKQAKVPQAMRLLHATNPHIRTLLRRDDIAKKIIGANAQHELAQNIIDGLTSGRDEYEQPKTYSSIMDYSDYLKAAPDEELIRFARTVRQMISNTSSYEPKARIVLGQRGESVAMPINEDNPFPMRDASIDRVLLSILKRETRRDSQSVLELLATRNRLHMSSHFPWAQYLEDTAPHRRRTLSETLTLYPEMLLGEYLKATMMMLRAATSDQGAEHLEDILELLTIIQDHIEKKMNTKDAVGERIQSTLPYAYLHDVIDVLYKRVDANKYLNTSTEMLFHLNHTVSRTGIMTSRSETAVEIRKGRAVLKQVCETDAPSPMRGTLTIIHLLPVSNITTVIPEEFSNGTILVTANMHILVNGFEATASRIIDERGNHMIEYHNVPGINAAKSDLVYRQRVSIQDTNARDAIAAYFGTHIAEQLYSNSPMHDAVKLIKKKTKEPMFTVQL